MRIRTVRKPGEPGTQKLVEKFGKRLVSVRYRYDPQAGKRYKTVELIIAEEDWQPPGSPDHPAPATEHPTTPLVPLRIQHTEKDLRRQLIAIGGTWNPETRLWYRTHSFLHKWFS